MHSYLIRVRRKGTFAIQTATAVLTLAITAASSLPARAAESSSSPIGSPKTGAAFDPKNFPVVPAKRFEDLKVGDLFRMPSRTLTEALTSAFQAVSLDNNPLHYDDDYAKRHGLKSALVQPIEVLAFAAPGASSFTLYIGDKLIAFTDLSCQFLRPSFVGDTLYPSIEITKLTSGDGKGYVTAAITIYNQRSELVLSGEQKFTLKLSPTT